MTKHKIISMALFIIGIVALYIVASLARIIYFIHFSKNPMIVQQGTTFGNGSSTLRYVAAGDSTAVGEGASDAKHSYPYLLAENFAKSHTVVYKNSAVLGATTQDVIQGQLQQIIAFDPDIITISIGANDRTHLTSNDAIYKNFQTIIQTLTTKTHAIIYLTDVPNFHNQTLLPLPYVWLLEHQTTSLNPKLLLLENARVKIVDIHNFGWDQYPDITQTISLDHFHPNDLGYINWTNAFLSKIDQ